MDELLAAIGVEKRAPVELYDNGATHILVALDSVEQVAGLRPTSRRSRVRRTGVDCFAGSGDRWTTRMFWEGGEDAATGSAAGPIACHLARHGKIGWATRS